MLKRMPDPGDWHRLKEGAHGNGALAFVGLPIAGAMAQGRTWLPAIDMHGTRNDLVLKVELPGVNDKDVAVSITGDLLTIKGERRWDDETKDQKFLHVERVYGRFERLSQLPLAVQADKVRAAYRDGVLEPREIKIDIQ